MSNHFVFFLIENVEMEKIMNIYSATDKYYVNRQFGRKSTQRRKMRHARQFVGGRYTAKWSTSWLKSTWKICFPFIRKANGRIEVGTDTITQQQLSYRADVLFKGTQNSLGKDSPTLLVYCKI